MVNTEASIWNIFDTFANFFCNSLFTIVIFVWLIGFWTLIFPMITFSKSHGCVGDFWCLRDVGEGVGLGG